MLNLTDVSELRLKGEIIQSNLLSVALAVYKKHVVVRKRFADNKFMLIKGKKFVRRWTHTKKIDKNKTKIQEITTKNHCLNTFECCISKNEASCSSLVP